MPLPKVRDNLAGTQASEKPISKRDALIRRDVEAHLKRQVVNAKGSWSRVDHNIFAGFQAKDQIEHLLTSQMMVVHDRAMDCFKRAAEVTNDHARREYEKHGGNLMSLFLRQTDALNKHRGKGQQTVTVEHVNVQPGGQAIVGNIRHNSDTAERP